MHFCLCSRCFARVCVCVCVCVCCVCTFQRSLVTVMTDASVICAER